ncbi:ribosome maturation factor RimM [Hymenobacter qilianensis]|uniref:Ribosome maturation factor RimM n=2 Tax=Hymenobacter qilianensis TaxID=1385715 RepID=A0ACB5PLF6_9BACT|nr:ribosome maturation factor RimM [Hymenobacter qilianensis]QNP50826.1 16S rRNA processing protein RimM [Hymenobacter qilianensis]GGF50442.1 ribosome maturation factor RimM [Hymenobacter qilianensis]
MTIDECYQLGGIGKTHGLKGFVVAYLDVDDVEAYSKMKSVWLELPPTPGKLIAFTVERVQPQTSDRVLLKLKGIDTVEAAEPLRNAKLFKALEELPELEEDQFYFHDVIGYTVVDETLGELGIVETFYEMPQQDLMGMRYQGQEVLIPVVDELVLHADEAEQKLHVSLPEGLLDVYLKPSSRERDEPDEFIEP